MEKFHKYCLSVLLVIIGSNISAHGNNGSLEYKDYKKLCEVYSRFWGFQNEPASDLSLKKSAYYHTIHYKQPACDIIELSPYRQQSGPILKFTGEECGADRYERILSCFENHNKDYEFAETIYFKSKVSKIRNKDYLDLIS